MVHEMFEIKGMLHGSCPLDGVLRTILTNEGHDIHLLVRLSNGRVRIVSINLCVTSCTLVG